MGGFLLVADRSDEACKSFLSTGCSATKSSSTNISGYALVRQTAWNIRYLDPLKLWVAAYYYNRAATWGKDVSLSTKKPLTLHSEIISKPSDQSSISKNRRAIAGGNSPRRVASG